MVWTLTAYGSLPVALPATVADEWERTLIAEKASILSGLNVKIPDEASYETRLAAVSSARYDDFLATVGAGWDAASIKLKQKVKLARKYADWATGIASVFNPSTGTFGASVTAKKGKLEALRYTIGLVGMKSQDKWRIAALTSLALAGDTRIETYIGSPDTLSGSLVPAIKVGWERFVKPLIVAQIVKYGVLAKYADEIGDSTTRNALILEMKNNLDDIMDAFKVTASTVTFTQSWDGGVDHLKLITAYTPP